FNDKHKGHEGMHLIMFLILVVAMASLPQTVAFWRRRHPRSYRLVSIASICLIPPYFALGSGYYRFIAMWLVYAIANIYVLYKATREPLHPSTPRNVYQWFAFINKASYAVSFLGGILFMFCFFDVIPRYTDSDFFVEMSMTTVFYGLYFGLMSRDLVTLCTDKMAATLGYSSMASLPTKTLPKHVCCVCGAGLVSDESDHGMLFGDSDPSSGSNAGPRVNVIAEPTHRLECGHEFHASCIRGWCVVGKRDICPFCREKVDLETFKQNPWDKQEIVYVTALEYMRYFISWQPLTILVLATIYWILGLE
ncbi:hypothetical protein EC988_008261, partial [Linderina pennispora]